MQATTTSTAATAIVAPKTATMHDADDVMRIVVRVLSLCDDASALASAVCDARVKRWQGGGKFSFTYRTRASSKS
jgi:hypothetical protein